MEELKIINDLRGFPIGDVPKDRVDLLSKASVVSYLARYQEQFDVLDTDDREGVVRDFYCSVFDEEIPKLDNALNKLKVSKEFVNDYGKMQYLKENNPNFNKTYDYLASCLQIEKSVKTK